MTTFTRVTVSGSVRRAELALPADEPVGSVLTDVVGLLREPAGTISRPFVLVDATGTELAPDRTPVQLGLVDGANLRLVPLGTAPPPPVVIDVADAAADAFPARTDRWRPAARVAVAGAAVAICAAIAGAAVAYAFPPETAAPTLGIGFVLLVLGAAAIARWVSPAAGMILAAGAAGVALPTGVVLAQGLSTTADPPTVAAGAIVLGLVWVVVLIAVGAGLGHTAALSAGALGVGLSLTFLVATWLGAGGAVASGLAGVVAVVAAGVLPWIALSSSGLGRIDQSIAEGEQVARTSVTGRIDDAYRAMTGGLVAVTAAISLSAVVLMQVGGVWPTLLAAALTVCLALRSRSFPLLIQGLTVWAGVLLVGAVAAVGVVIGLGLSGLWILLAAAVVALVAGLVNPPPHVRARLRSIGNLIEWAVVISLVPLLVGCTGAYGELIGLFGG